MAEIKLVFTDEIGEDGEEGIAIKIEDESGSLEVAEATGELTQAQLACLEVLAGLEFAADAIYVDDELVAGNDLREDKETH